MRDVTDNWTGELEMGEVKRGRGRPRKADAMTNAERQAAYRARRRAERVRAMVRAVGDPEALQDVAKREDDVAKLRAELDATKSTLDKVLAENQRLQKQLALASAAWIRAADECDTLRAELIAVKKGAQKVVTGNGNPVSFDDMCELLTRVRRARTWHHRVAITCEDDGVWSRAIVRTIAVSEDQMEQVRYAIVGEPKT